MNEFDTAAFLKARHEAKAILKNIKTFRDQINKGEFDAKRFEHLNGSDCAIESLLGCTINPELLDKSELRNLRRKALATLEKSETEAFESLRNQTLEFFARLDKVIRISNTDKDVIKRIGLISDESLAAFAATKTDSGSLEADRCLSTLERMETVCEAIEDLVPVLTRIYDEADEDGLNEEENKEEKHEEQNGEDPEHAEKTEEENTEGEEEEENTEEELPDATEEEEKDDPEETEELGTVSDEWINDLNEFNESAKTFISSEDKTLKDLHFTAEFAGRLLSKRDAVTARYIADLEYLKDVVRADTCVQFDLVRGSRQFYNKIDKVIRAVESLEPLRTALEKSVDAINAASKQMYTVYTTKQ